jgi:hypothetical protein
MNVNAALNAPHPYLVMQVFLPVSESFTFEISVRDKQNVSANKFDILLA